MVQENEYVALFAKSSRRLACAQRLKAKVSTVELDQVEGPHEHVRVIPSVSDAIER
jgi:hypothetical protein